MKNKKIVLFTDKYNPDKYDRQPLPEEIFNKTGAVLAPKGAKLSKDRLINAYIYVDDSFNKDLDYESDDKPKTEEQAEETKEEREVPQDQEVVDVEEKEDEAEEVEIDEPDEYEPGFELSNEYEEDSAKKLDKKLDDLAFEPIPKIKQALRTNIYDLKEIFKKKIVNNIICLATEDNEKLSLKIADYIDYITDINMYASDYIDMITAIRTKNNYVSFSHACAVAFYSNAITKKLKMIRDDLILEDNMGRWIPIKTKTHDKKSGIIPLPNQLLKYIDYQKNNIMVKYGTEISTQLFDDIHDLMYEYAKIKREDNYQSLSVNFEKNLRRLLTMAALNSDIGKVCIPNKILNKSAPLTSEELQILKKHPAYSVVKLKEVNVNQPKMFAYIIGHHILGRENDYPTLNRMPPPESKIIAVADIYDAMTSPKHYGERNTHQEALAFIKRLYDEKSIDLPLYLVATHTFHEYNHEFVKRRHKKMTAAHEEE